VRASGSDRIISCPASLHLPRIDRPGGDAAEFGTLVHHWAETGEHDPDWGKPGHIKTLAKKLAESKIDRLAWWPPGHGEHEVTYAIHLPTLKLTIRDKEPGEPRDAADKWKKQFVGHEWLTGSIDWCFFGDDEHLPWIDDLKTGSWPVEADDNKQLMSYALVPWFKAGRPLDWECAISITQWKKYPVAGLPVRTGSKVTGLDLFEHVDRLRWSAEHPDETNPTEDNCRFCGSQTFCSAFADANGN
jgi:Protein of unknown function (DUF2800)